MGQTIIIAKAGKHPASTKKAKRNRAREISSTNGRARPGLSLQREMVKRGNKTDALFLEYYCLFKIASTLSEPMNVERTITAVKQLVRQNFPVDQYALMLLDESGQDLELKSYYGISHKQARHASDEDVFGATVKRRRPIYLPDVRQAAYVFPFHLKHREKGGAFLSLPLPGGNGGVVGVVGLFRRAPNSFSAQEIKLLKKIAEQTGQVIDTMAAYHHTRELSITDELTGICNRRYFNQMYEREIQRAQRYSRALSLIMLDIDHFKIFNDTHGHLVGDAILKQVARVLEESIRKADILARYGGEEFVIMLPEIDKEHGRTVAEKLRRAVEHSQFPHAETQPLGRITVSLGLASFPEDAGTAEALLARADQGLYLAKSRGRNQVGEYQSE
jgi:diguanylate cyclase (GGDEF)-like protein